VIQHKEGMDLKWIEFKWTLLNIKLTNMIYVALYNM
jgi:hypothetical protein